MADLLLDVPFDAKRDIGLFFYSSTGVGQVASVFSVVMGIVAIVKKIQQKFWEKQASYYEEKMEKATTEDKKEKYKTKMITVGEKSERRKKESEIYTQWCVFLALGAIPVLGGIYGYRVSRRLVTDDEISTVKA